MNVWIIVCGISVNVFFGEKKFVGKLVIIFFRIGVVFVKINWYSLGIVFLIVKVLKGNVFWWSGFNLWLKKVVVSWFVVNVNFKMVMFGVFLWICIDMFYLIIV